MEKEIGIMSLTEEQLQMIAEFYKHKGKYKKEPMLNPIVIAGQDFTIHRGNTNVETFKVQDIGQLIDKFLELYNKYCHIPSKELKEFPTAKEYILKHLEDED